MERKQSAITEVGLLVKLNGQSRKVFLLRNLTVFDAFFSVVSALYLLFSVLSSPAL